MRRIAATVGALVAALLLVIAVPGAASAAQGVMVLNGDPYFDPYGCYTSDRWPMTLDNFTDEIIYVFYTPYCEGGVMRLVYPGEQAIEEFGASVYVS